MINLENVFKNIFHDARVGDDKLKKFAEDHLGRLSTTSDPQLSTILTDTTAAFEDYFGEITNEALHATIKKSYTKTTDDSIVAFLELLKRQEGLIRSIYGDKSATYMEFFPLGMSEYHQATKANIETLMNRFVRTAEKYIEKLGADFVDSFADLRDQYSNARKAQVMKKGDVNNAKVGTSENRTKLEMQLTTNVHTIALTYPGNVEKAIRFFDQSIVRPSESSVVTDQEAK